LIEEDPDYSQLVVFAEGGTSNGKHLLSFKKGAFYGMRAVQPMVLVYNSEKYTPAWDVTPFFPQVMMQMCLGGWRVQVKILPPFKPNEYLLKTHADKGKEDWEIFAWAVRDCMAKAGPLIKND
jgi:lysophosphatidylcholine acyltransferase/lyso-PAF acetyltransferase